MKGLLLEQYMQEGKIYMVGIKYYVTEATGRQGGERR